jgi:hypothetical protein
MIERYGARAVAELERMRAGREKVTDGELREALEWLKALD